MFDRFDDLFSDLGRVTYKLALLEDKVSAYVGAPVEVKMMIGREMRCLEDERDDLISRLRGLGGDDVL